MQTAGGRSINRLSEDVVNRIAAGEVIQRPANAIKEMLENSLDAKSTSISVVLKDGGLKFLQIQDNGTGIKRADMDIVCERFTTSKLSKFEDLTGISTYGFRGEALASISHVAHVAIVSKTADSLCAYKGCYADGKLKENLKTCAGNVGTQITVEDLFYNVPMRRHALKSTSEEHNKVVDVVTKYAVHNPLVGFSVKKQNDSGVDVRTPSNSTKVENIRLLYGNSISRELLTLTHEEQRLCFKMDGLVTNANYSSKKRFFILFINHRLVESADLRKAIENLYAAYLPKGTYPFVYISLEISPQNIDVNVHPTKSEVHFLNEIEIFDVVQRKLDTCLLGANNSRTYFTQMMLPTKINEDDVQKVDSNGSLNASFTVRSDSKARKLDAYLVPSFNNNNSTNLGSVVNFREDDKRDGSSSEASKMAVDDDDDDDCIIAVEEADIMLQSRKSKEHASSDDAGALSGPISSSSLSLPQISSSSSAPTTSSSSAPTTSSLSTPVTSSSTTRRKIVLSSVLQLQKEIESNTHVGLREILKNSTFVGCVDVDHILLQHQTRLYLVNLSRLSQELFYQMVIFDFSNFGVMKLSEPVSIYELSMLALDSLESGWSPGDGPKEELSGFVVSLLQSKAEMLWDYFSLQISKDGNLCTLPLLMNNYFPQLDDLPKFVIRLATEVDWEKEKNCFKTMAEELSRFYVLKKEFCDTEKADLEVDDLSVGGANEDQKNGSGGGENDISIRMDLSDDAEVLSFAAKSESNNNRGIPPESEIESKDCEEQWKWSVEHAIYPALKSIFLPPKKCANDGSLLQLANLPDLYKVFERC